MQKNRLFIFILLLIILLPMVSAGWFDWFNNLFNGRLADLISGKVVSSRDLIAHYAFEDNIQDSAGMNHGINNGATFVDGKVGKALNFYGNEYVGGFGNKFNMGTNDFSLEAWIRTTSLNAGTILGKMNTQGSNYPAYVMDIYNGRIRTFLVTANSNYIVDLGYSNINDGNWHHIVLSVDRNSLANLYVDGESRSSVDVSSHASESIDNEWDFYIGKRNSGVLFTGGIDEVKIYNKALNEDEVKDLYENIMLSCTNECSSGQKICSETGYKTCGNYDSDSCLEWSNVQSCPSNLPWCDRYSGICVECLDDLNCPSNQICQNKICVSTCIPNCTNKVCGDDGCGGSCGICELPANLSSLLRVDVSETDYWANYYKSVSHYNGLAGICLTLTSAYKYYNEEQYKQKAVEIGNYLIKKKDVNGDGKVGWGTPFETGASSLNKNPAHTEYIYYTAEVIKCLSDLYYITKNESYLNVAIESVEDSWNIGISNIPNCNNCFYYWYSYGNADIGRYVRNTNVQMARSLVYLYYVSGVERYRERALQCLNSEFMELSVDNQGYFGINDPQYEKYRTDDHLPYHATYLYDIGELLDANYNNYIIKIMDMWANNKSVFSRDMPDPCGVWSGDIDLCTNPATFYHYCYMRDVSSTMMSNCLHELNEISESQFKHWPMIYILPFISSFYMDNDNDSWFRLDCNDSNAGINPGAEELCNNDDDDCDGVVDNNCILTTSCNGSYTGFYNFPTRFFSESIVHQDQILKVTDAQYLGLKDMHNGISPYSFAKIEYEPSAYGMTTPYGIKIGDFAFPSLNSGNPRWEIMAHEQGHNFFGGTSQFYYNIASPYPFIQESFAVLSAFYTYHYILENKDTLGISSSTINSLNFDFNNGKNYQESMYNQYISQGKNFNINNVLTSQALDYKMITYGEMYGWNNYKEFTKAFENGISTQFTFQNNGVSATEQSTYIIASLNVAFNKDFRQDFKNLNFPIDENLYQNIYPKIIEYIYPTVCTDNDNDGYSIGGGSCGDLDCDDSNNQIYPGKSIVCSISNLYGICNGQKQCLSNGSYDGCDAIIPSVEICDGIDNNCDRNIDEGCGCINGRTQECGIDVGECSKGLQTCSNGKWGICVGEIKSIVDNNCDNKDNDCDGLADEDYVSVQTRCGVGSCAGNIGEMVCVKGDEQDTCDPYRGAIAESCEDDTGYDSIDNNCDGVIDLGCDSYCDKDDDGYSSHLVCLIGYSTGDCDDSNANVNPGAYEICNDDKDDDCDGNVDCDDRGCEISLSCIQHVCGDNECERDENKTNCEEDCGDYDDDGVINSIDICLNTSTDIPKERINNRGCVMPKVTGFILNDLDNENLRNVRLNLTKENKAKIEFFEGVDVEDLDLDKIIEIKDKKINITSDRLNEKARLTFYNITYNNPQVYRNGVLCLECIIINHANNILIIDVPGFSSYDIEEGPYCGDNSCNGDETCSSCSSDCGSCPSSPSSGGGGGGGSGGGSYRSVVEVSCSQVSYNCNEWDECNELSYQNKVCTNITKCDGNEFSKIDVESRNCGYEEIGVPGDEVVDIKRVGESKKEKPIKLIIISIIVIIGILLYSFFRRRSKPIKDYSNYEITMFVRRSLKKGYTKKEIRDALVKANINKKEVDKALSEC